MGARKQDSASPIRSRPPSEYLPIPLFSIYCRPFHPVNENHSHSRADWRDLTQTLEYETIYIPVRGTGTGRGKPFKGSHPVTPHGVGD